MAPDATPTTVTITGAGGQIGYALLFRIAAGDMLGPDRPVRLRLLEIPQGMRAAEGAALELMDGAFPLLTDVEVTDDAHAGRPEDDADVVVGASLVNGHGVQVTIDVHQSVLARPLLEDVDVVLIVAAAASLKLDKHALIVALLGDVHGVVIAPELDAGQTVSACLSSWIAARLRDVGDVAISRGHRLDAPMAEPILVDRRDVGVAILPDLGLVLSSVLVDGRLVTASALLDGR